jgi:hypothetical protein
MECNICFDDNIIESNMVYLGCFHSICKKCFDRLKKDSCPFCRECISSYLPFNNENNEENEIEEEIFSMDEDLAFDNVYRNRKNRHEHKRKRIDKKRRQLHQCLHACNNCNNMNHNTVSDDYLSTQIFEQGNNSLPIDFYLNNVNILPNNKTRTNRKNNPDIYSRSL